LETDRNFSVFSTELLLKYEYDPRTCILMSFFHHSQWDKAMNQIKDKNKPERFATRKITKNEIPLAIQEGITHATLANKGVNKRLKKQQEKIKRQQDLRENAIRLQNKALQEAKKRTAPANGEYQKGVKGAVQKVVDASIAEGAAELRKLQESMNLHVQAPDPEPSVVEIIANTLPVPGPAEEVHAMTFTDGAIDTNDDPKNFGRQSVDPESGEDGIVINPDSFKDYSTRVYEPDQLKVQVPLNLYGSELNYKPLPEIGEHVRADGLLFGVRVMDRHLQKPKASDLLEFLQPDPVKDALVYAVPGIQVTEELLSTLSDEDRQLAAKYTMKAHISDSGINKMYSEAIDWDKLREVGEITKTTGIPSDILFDQGLSIRDVTKIRAEEFTALPEGFVLDDVSLPTTDLDAPGMEGAKEAFLKLTVGTADIGDSSENMQQFREAIASNIPGLDNENVKLQNSGISGAFIDAENPWRKAALSQPTLTAQCRVESGYSTDENSITDGDGNPVTSSQAMELLNKDEGAGDNSFSLEP
jgi:hypothetical protein